MFVTVSIIALVTLIPIVLVCISRHVAVEDENV